MMVDPILLPLSPSFQADLLEEWSKLQDESEIRDIRSEAPILTVLMDFLMMQIPKGPGTYPQP